VGDEARARLARSPKSIVFTVAKYLAEWDGQLEGKLAPVGRVLLFVGGGCEEEGRLSVPPESVAQGPGEGVIPVDGLPPRGARRVGMGGSPAEGTDHFAELEEGRIDLGGVLRGGAGSQGGHPGWRDLTHGAIQLGLHLLAPLEVHEVQRRRNLPLAPMYSQRHPSCLIRWGGPPFSRGAQTRRGCGSTCGSGPSRAPCGGRKPRGRPARPLPRSGRGAGQSRPGADPPAPGVCGARHGSPL
jgi:hypothetical protein